MVSALGRADDSINEEARRHFTAGVSLLQDPDGARYEDAYREFEAAYAASNSPKILGNIGYCALKLERDGEAISAYTRYLQDAHDVDPAEAAQITRDVATLRAGLVHLAVLAEGPGLSVVDKRVPVRGDSITNVYSSANGKIEIGVRPGHHVLTVKVNGEAMDPWEFDAKPGATLSKSFAAKPATAPEAPVRHGSQTLPWVVTSIGGAALVAGGIFGAMTLAKVNAMQNDCPNNICPPGYALDSKKSDALRFRTTTDALLIGGGVVAATGLWLVFATGGSESPRALPATRGASAQASIGCAASGCLATVHGAF
jgi:hypothetical protein